MEPAFCPIELLHPDGPGRRRAVLGSNCAAFFYSRGTATGTGSLDFVLVAPDASERPCNRFLQQATALVSGSLSADGLAYVLAPALWRRRLRRRLREADFTFGPTIAHLPASRPDQILVPADSHMLRYAASAVTNLARGRRRLLSTASQLPGIPSVLAWMSSEAGVVVRRVGARPLLEWLAIHGYELANAVIRTKWRAHGGTAVLHCFTAHEATPVAVAKVALDERPASRVKSEAQALDRLGPAAARAGIRVPTAKVIRSQSGHPILVERYLAGQRASTLLNSGAIDEINLLTHLTEWLKEWNRATVTGGFLDERQLESHVLSPARRLAPVLRSGTQYVIWLQQLAATALGRSIPLVATHNDLTMQNVLLLPGATPAVLDWEAAREHGFPMTDFFYMAVDLVVAAGQIENRRNAFLDCFARDTPGAANIVRLGGRLAQALRLSSDLIQICFHACWIQHASNEIEKKLESDPRPFVAILNWLADHPGDVRLPPVR
jgi:hypothetical protein